MTRRAGLIIDIKSNKCHCEYLSYSYYETRLSNRQGISLNRGVAHSPEHRIKSQSEEFQKILHEYREHHPLMRRNREVPHAG